VDDLKSDPLKTFHEILLVPGTRLAHYEIRRWVGAGAMGNVYEAWDTALDRRVALKLLRPEVADRERLVSRFEFEARAAARVNHPNLVQVYFVGGEGYHRFFAMEFLPGPTLEVYVAARGGLDLVEALDLLQQAALSLQAVHSAGVIHRDVKPGNLILDGRHRLKVTDFGLSKSIAASGGASSSGILLGTPRYMSPEQCRGEDIDGRSDVYALGLVAYHLLTGRHAFETDSLGALLDAQMNAPIPDIRSLRPDLPAEVRTVLEAMTAKAKDRRPPDMASVVTLLEGLRPLPEHPASLAARISACVVDWFVACFLMGLLGGLRSVGSQPYTMGTLQQVIFFVLFLGSQAGMEFLKGGSPGKLALNLTVLARGAGPPGVLRCLARFLVRFPASVLFILPWSPDPVSEFFVGLQALAVLAGFGVFLARGRRSLSDLLTGTRVIIRSHRSGFRGPADRPPDAARGVARPDDVIAAANAAMERES
jgi:tRNA A-37 threonylcarbamoyl transferase component Bud32/uncharacterized RDD family membrane protein YckC